MARPTNSLRSARRARALRKSMTPSEAHLWQQIRRGATGTRFRRQVPIGEWIVDFASLEVRLVLEVDGGVHNQSDETHRTHDLELRGFTVLRFTNEEVWNDVVGVAGTIAVVVDQLRSV
ncbi:MAG: endonuclease domain-containing protein [Acidimicrobiia bacterium]|nr:endonuclease domain-containing protein [Acidimicrobiia bacterium]